MKKIFIIFILLLLVTSLVGCSKDDLKAYMEAVDRTNDIKRGQILYEVKMETDFNTDGLSAEEIKQLSYIRKVESSAYVTFDGPQSKSIIKTYFNFGGLGFDTILYNDGEKTFVRMPILGKYIIMDGYEQEENIEASPISKEGIQKINEKWLKLLNNEDVTSGEKTLLDTEDGEVKVTRFSISPTEEQVKMLFKEAIKVLKEDEKLDDFISNNIYGYGVDEVTSMDDIFKDLESEIDKINVKEVKYDVYIDIDGYIIQNDIYVEVEARDPKPGEARTQKFTLKGIRWSIEKEQKFEFPLLTEENVLDTNDANQGMPFIFEGIFKPVGNKGDK